MDAAIKVAVLGGMLGVMAWKVRDYLARDDETGEGDEAPDLIDYTMQAADTGAGFFESYDDMSVEKNTAAFLMALRLGEGTSAAHGYEILCGGGRMKSFAQHPALLGWTGWRMPLAMAAAAGFPNGAVSTAAGAFQITRPTWKRVSAKCGLTDFTPASQDKAALQLIAEKGALGDVQAGRVELAVSKVRKIWASLPGAGYGQREVGMLAFVDKFKNAGGTLA